MLCRFENRLAGEALELKNFSHRIAVTSASGLDAAFRDIADAQARGYWIALLLDYELGEWLEPGSIDGNGVDALSGDSIRPRLTALVYKEAEYVPVWQGPGSAEIASSMSEHAGFGSDTLKAAGMHTRLAASAQATAGAAAEATVMATEKSTAEAADQVAANPTATTTATTTAQTTASTAALLSATALMPRSRYLGHIEALRGSIARGEIYQANYTFPIAIETRLSPQTLYREIASHHPCAHAAYVEDEGRTLLSFSPELFFARSGSTLTVRPMKGTAPRFADPEQDRQSGQQLLHSEKNRAENLMIVDLLRNDLGRVATPGTVKVDALFTLEQYPSVWTLTSTVTAQAPGASLETLLRALFPCGSITGAPKIAAMKKIRELEMAERGIYCGSIGWLAPNGDCSLNVAIRTITMQGGESKGVFGVGGGIVYDSAPEQEWQECLWKARILGTQLVCVDETSGTDQPQGNFPDTGTGQMAGMPGPPSGTSSGRCLEAKS